MKNNREIAILMSVYNGERYLREQIDSIISQTNKKWTLYIRDDCSTDSSLEIINEYVNDFNVFLINDNLGNIGAKNSFFQLLSIVDSHYYMFADQDDVWLPQKIEVSFNSLKEQESKEGHSFPLLVCCDVHITNDKLDIIEMSEWKMIGINDNSFVSYNSLLVNPTILGMTMCFNKAVKNISFPVNPYIGMHDSWIAYIVAKYGRIYAINSPLVLYRQHGKNVCGVKSRKKIKLLYKLCNPREVFRLNIDKYKRIRNIETMSFFKYIYFKISILLQRKINKIQ